MCAMGFKGCNFKALKSKFNLKDIWWNQSDEKIFIYGALNNVISASDALNKILNEDCASLTVDVSSFKLNTVMCAMGFKGCNFKKIRLEHKINSIRWNPSDKNIIIQGPLQHIHNAKSCLDFYLGFYG